MSDGTKQEKPFQGGSQPVTERPPEVPSAGRSVLQWVVIIVAVLVVLAGVLYVVGRTGAAA